MNRSFRFLEKHTMLIQGLTLSFPKEILYFILISCCMLFHIIKRKLIFYKYHLKKPGNLAPDNWNCFPSVNCSFGDHLVFIHKKIEFKTVLLEVQFIFFRCITILLSKWEIDGKELTLCLLGVIKEYLKTKMKHTVVIQIYWEQRENL